MISGACRFLARLFSGIRQLPLDVQTIHEQQSEDVFVLDKARMPLLYKEEIIVLKKIIIRSKIFFFKFLKLMPMFSKRRLAHETHLIEIQDGFIINNFTYWPRNLRGWKWKNPYNGISKRIIGKADLLSESDDFINETADSRVYQNTRNPDNSR